MPDPAPRFVERAPRFRVRNIETIYAHIEREPGREPVALEAEPIDISEGGCKLRVDTALSFEEPFTLVIGSMEGPLRLTLSCRVRWLREECEGIWVMGCQFHPNLPHEAMEEMFRGGLIERRQFPRFRVTGEATVQWELQSQPFAATPLDLSEAGFCIRCPQGTQVGQRLRLTYGSGEATGTLQAKAEWSLELEEATLIGCSFVDTASYAGLRKAWTQAT